MAGKPNCDRIPLHLVYPGFVDRKVAFVLTELGLTYESIYLDFNKLEQKAPEYTQYNPNGRIPTLIDHKNNDFTVWSVISSLSAARTTRYSRVWSH